MHNTTPTVIRNPRLLLSAMLLVGTLPIAGSTLGADSAAQNSMRHYVTTPGTWQAQRGFSEVVVLEHPARLIYLAGIGANAEGKEGNVLFPGDFKAQCQFAWKSIERLLASEGATVRDIVKITTYVTDVKNLDDMGACRRQAFDNTPPFPPHTFLTISALADPKMLIEIDVTAAITR
jgi:2-iminobutanoate/2-iminopropanoate deaminase